VPLLAADAKGSGEPTDRPALKSVKRRLSAPISKGSVPMPNMATTMCVIDRGRRRVFVFMRKRHREKNKNRERIKRTSSVSYSQGLLKASSHRSRRRPHRRCSPYGRCGICCRRRRRRCCRRRRRCCCGRCRCWCRRLIRIAPTERGRSEAQRQARERARQTTREEEGPRTVGRGKMGTIFCCAG